MPMCWNNGDGYKNLFNLENRLFTPQIKSKTSNTGEYNEKKYRSHCLSLLGFMRM